MLLGSCLMTYLEGRRYSHPRLPPTHKRPCSPPSSGRTRGAQPREAAPLPGGAAADPRPGARHRARPGWGHWGSCRRLSLGCGSSQQGPGGVRARWGLWVHSEVRAGGNRARGHHQNPPRLCQGGTAGVTVARNVAG